LLAVVAKLGFALSAQRFVFPAALRSAALVPLFRAAGFNLHSVLQIITFEGDGSGYQLFLIVVVPSALTLSPG